jgi:hypothetical protein
MNREYRIFIPLQSADPAAEVTYRVQLVSATSEGNWASQCDGQTYPTRAAAQAAIDADLTTRPDGCGGSCVVEIVEVVQRSII